MLEDSQKQDDEQSEMQITLSIVLDRFPQKLLAVHDSHHNHKQVEAELEGRINEDAQEYDPVSLIFPNLKND